MDIKEWTTVAKENLQVELSKAFKQSFFFTVLLLETNLFVNVYFC
jgi:hypothetical protein